MSTDVSPQSVETVTLPDDWEQISQEFYDRGCTDGLPIVPPTEDRVDRLVEASGLDGDELVAVLPPRRGKATVRILAANAVMAGCGPEHFPPLLAAVRGISDSRFNLEGILGSTHNSSVLMLLSGPIVRDLQIDTGGAPYSETWRPTAVIGRALVLTVLNVAAVRGSTFNETQGAMVRYTHCFGENLDDNPWDSLRTDRGFSEETSTVTVIPALPAQHVDDMGSTTAVGVLTTMADSMANVGNRNANGEGEPWVVLGPQHASTVARDGWSKADVQRFIFENARVSLDRFPPGMVHSSFSRRWMQLYGVGYPGAAAPVADCPEDVAVVVSGGAGTHSLFIQTQLGGRSVTMPVG